MKINIVDVGSLTKEAKYSHFTLKYEDKGKTFTRKIVSFSPVYDALAAAKAGDTFNVEIKKDQNGNWTWEKASPDVASASPAAGGGTKGNWETAEERARRQILIVRQSCLAQSVASFRNA